METRTCQNCKSEFVIEPEDFNFYEKIKVPPPTFCPECRTIRRLCFRNEMSLFKRPCNFHGHKEILISAFHPDEKLVVYDLKSWWGDGWNPLDFGREYDFSKSFFAQWRDFRDSFPLQALSNSNAVNSDYCNVADDSKNCYLISGSESCEQTMYSNRIIKVKDSLDLYIVNRSELCYDDVYCFDCYRVLYSINCKNCVDSYFLYDCVNCVNCFGCSNLRNKSYCLWNQQLTQKEYKEKIKGLNLNSRQAILNFKKEFNKLYINSIHRFANQVKTINSTGNNLIGAKDCKYCFDLDGQIENSKNVHWGGLSIKDVYDGGPGIGNTELAYEMFDTGLGSHRSLCTSVVYGSSDVEYSFNCYNSSNLFACFGLRSKKYCIFNKQYSKEEYERMVNKIKDQMNEIPYIDKNNRTYRYGEFFPIELSPFAYNETVAQDYFPITKEIAEKMGYKWRDKIKNEYNVTLNSKNIPDNLNETNASILKEVIECANNGKDNGRCLGVFRILENELNLYKRIGVPVPNLCFACRHAERLSKRTSLKLWRRQCMCEKEGHGHKGRCQVEFETSYAPDLPEIVYCEKCYQKEVY